MLLNLTCHGPHAADFSYLLHKAPASVNIIELPFGEAVVFYPLIEEQKLTCSMLIDIDPLTMAKGEARFSGLFDYLSDRPYAATSFMSVAIARVFGTALSGRCQNRPEVVTQKLSLQADIFMLRCGHLEYLNSIFEPLGYETNFEIFPVDKEFPKLGRSPYVNLTIKGEVTLQDLLRHLYVLIPVFDGRKHYWIGRDEVEKLLRHGQGWLSEHPQRGHIARRYLSRLNQLTNMALGRLDNGESGARELEPEPGTSAEPPEKLSLNRLRLEVVLAELKASGVTSVLDFGCGEGKLLRRLLREKQFERVAGLDVSLLTLKRAEAGLLRVFKTIPPRLELLHGAMTYKDQRLKGFTAVVCQEVIEHLDPWRRPAMEKIVFEYIGAKVVVVTTPNREYNVNYFSLKDQLRHRDHRFEWDRQEFGKWAASVAQTYGYTVRLSGIGDLDESAGQPTQIGVFSQC
ncbi:MAG: 3' terminal RNA ribose 2'-O-methyltransferase Hen1 [Deltaproteobacteria bacterium]|jgi:3' terminal RNA ribose 2'-O-methyltransferase Hen1|nr:3' terminal RNA ribose 2'-O-methyltransferase Hen1 [Deltaproteobacteria bacterium]